MTVTEINKDVGPVPAQGHVWCTWCAQNWLAGIQEDGVGLNFGSVFFHDAKGFPILLCWFHLRRGVP